MDGMAKVIHLYKAGRANERVALCAQPQALATLEASLYFERGITGKVCGNCLKSNEAKIAAKRARLGSLAQKGALMSEKPIESEKMEIKPAIKAPLPMWGKVLILVLSCTGILVIAGLQIADCVQRHG